MRDMNWLREARFYKGLVTLAWCLSMTLLLSIPLAVEAHPGNTDSYGCHTCRTNCAKWGLSSGEYHCHNAKALPQPKAPIRSHYDESGGRTEPWPEYEAHPVTPPRPTVTPSTTREKDVPPIVAPVIKHAPHGETPTQKTEKQSWLRRLFSWLF